MNNARLTQSKKQVGLALNVIFLLLLSLAFHGYAISFSDETVVVKSSELLFEPEDDYVADGTLSILKYGKENRWILPFWDRKHGGIVHLITEGMAGNPLAKKLWLRKQSQLFANLTSGDGNLWIVNTYVTENGILAFVHVEAVGGTGRPGYTGKTRLGLAWSTNDGRSFTYLGPIVSAHADPNPHNVQGGSYLIKNGYFYVYFHDTKGITVARAPVNEVLSGVKKGITTKWLKYMGDEKGFSSPAMGGESATIGVKGVSHSDAACSTYTGKCYLILTRMTWGGGNSYIKMVESLDGVHWENEQTISELVATKGVRGYQYAAIADAGQLHSPEVSNAFYLYAARNHLDQDRTYVRWLVKLDDK